MFKQGTMSILFGCHSILVTISWKKLYGEWPEFWELICIFLHDVGHWGTNYLDNENEKRDHWIGGAHLAMLLFGDKGYHLIAGHCKSGQYDESYETQYPDHRLYKPDKYSHYIAPKLWIWWNTFPEPKLKMDYISRWDAVNAFKSKVKNSIESGEYHEPHSFYLNRCK
jgi:hypothetical protein